MNAEKVDSDWAYWGGQKYQTWLAEHGASTEHYITLVVTGFPLQSIEGHGTGGAREWLPPGKGLGALVANFLLWTVAFVALVYAVPKRFLWWLSWPAAALAGVSGIVGWGILDVDA